jgi:serine/threonine protein phosphatase PrpC
LNIVPQRFDLQLQPGDIIVTGSDGLWDNIFAEEAATIASKCRDKGETATTAAQVLCRCAEMQPQMHRYKMQSCELLYAH